MATNIILISPEKAGKALDITCDFQEMNLLPRISCHTLPAKTPGRVLWQETKIIDALASRALTAVGRRLASREQSEIATDRCRQGQVGCSPPPAFGERYHGVTFLRREMSILRIRLPQRLQHYHAGDKQKLSVAPKVALSLITRFSLTEQSSWHADRPAARLSCCQESESACQGVTKNALPSGGGGGNIPAISAPPPCS